MPNHVWDIIRDEDPETCAACGAVEGTPEYDDWHDSVNCWANSSVTSSMTKVIDFNVLIRLKDRTRPTSWLISE